MKRFLSGVLVIPVWGLFFFHKDDFHLTAFGTKCSLLSQRKGAQKNLVLFNGHQQINCAFLWGNQLALDIQIPSQEVVGYLGLIQNILVVLRRWKIVLIVLDWCHFSNEENLMGGLSKLFSGVGLYTVNQQTHLAG